MIKNWIIKNKILKILKKDASKQFNSLEISDKIYHSLFGQIVYYKWSDIYNALNDLINENKIIKNNDEYGIAKYSISRRYDDDRFLYKG